MTSINHRLIEMSKEGNEAAVKTLLLDPRCKPKAVDSEGQTALMNAASNGHMSCLQLLLPASDALDRDNDGWTALIYAARHKETLCLELLLPASDALVKDNNGWTALMYAAFHENTSCVQLLLPVSDCSARNSQLQTASELATDHRYPELGRLIDAYILLVSEWALLESSTFSARARKPGSLRV